MNITIDNPKVFLQSILGNTDHTMATLSEILDIPKKRMLRNKFTQKDYLKMIELKKMIVNSKCHWVR